jgi:diphthine synthase
MLYIIGLGLSDVEDITVKGLKAVQSSDKVYLEHYTSILGGGETYVTKLEEFYNKKIILADRTMVEQNSDEIIDSAKDSCVSFLVVGDPFGATTHTDLVLRAIEKNIAYIVIHNASIMNAVGCCGLQLYNFGETVSFCFWNEKENWKPKSYVPKVCDNRSRGLHTLCLLDIKVKEKSMENLIRGRDIYEPPRFMTVAQACDQMMQIIQEARLEINNNNPKKEDDKDDEIQYENPIDLQIRQLIKANLLDENTLCVGLARVGRDDQQLCVNTIKNLAQIDMGEPLHSLIVAGKLHPLEIDFLKLFHTQAESSESFEHLVELHNKNFNK